MKLRADFSSLAFALLTAFAAEDAAAAEHVILISVDGLRPEAIETLGDEGAPNFARLRREGAWTHNARSDYGWTSTVPNHSSMVTGRQADGVTGHNYTTNGNPPASATYALNKGSYVAGIFDVAHDHGLKTAFYSSKSKLAIIAQSYNAANGAADATGPDNGAGKIDAYLLRVINNQSGALVTAFAADILAHRYNLTLLHLVDPDPVGHGNNWQTAAYYEAVQRVDGYLGQIFAALDGDPALAQATALIVTADHGGLGAAHDDEADAQNYTIPFYAWGAEVKSPGSLYGLNAGVRADPGTGRPDMAASPQPIRNSDAGNLALSLLALPPVPGSTVNADQSLRVAPPRAAGRFAVAQTQRHPGHGVGIRWESLGLGYRYTVQVAETPAAAWRNAPGVAWPIAHTAWVDVSPAAREKRLFYRVAAEPPPAAQAE